MSIQFDQRNHQVLIRGHGVMVKCKTYCHSPDTSLPGELSKIADEARGYCLDAPESIPNGAMSKKDGPFGWFPSMSQRP